MHESRQTMTGAHRRPTLALIAVHAYNRSILKGGCMTKRTALLVGATGLVGQNLLPLLLDVGVWKRVTTLSRRPIDLQHRRLRQKVFDFDTMAAHADAIAADDIFCCLGTTLREAGDKARFHRVDYDYSMQVATLAQRAGAEHFLLLSALGADEKSLFFYSQVKGRLERDLVQLNYPRTSIFQPSLLLGERRQQRSMERWAGWALTRLDPLLAQGPLSHLRAVPAQRVALAMRQVAVERPFPGPHTYTCRDIFAWSAALSLQSER